MRPEGERPAKLAAALHPALLPLLAAVLPQAARRVVALARLVSPPLRPLGRRRRRGDPRPGRSGRTTPPQAVPRHSVARAERVPPAARELQPVQMSESSGLS